MVGYELDDDSKSLHRKSPFPSIFKPVGLGGSRYGLIFSLPCVSCTIHQNVLQLGFFLRSNDMKALISKTNIKSMGSTKKLEDKLRRVVSRETSLVTTVFLLSN